MTDEDRRRRAMKVVCAAGRLIGQAAFMSAVGPKSLANKAYSGCDNIDYVKRAGRSWHNRDTVRRIVKPLPEGTSTSAYRPPRHAINDGAYGEFTLDVSEKCIELEFNARFTDTFSTNHTF
jgi:hypothetical protein